MTSRTPPHPFGHGPPPSPSELARFHAIAAELAGDCAQPGRRRIGLPLLTRSLGRLHPWFRIDDDRPPSAEPRSGRR